MYMPTSCGCLLWLDRDLLAWRYATSRMLNRETRAACLLGGRKICRLGRPSRQTFVTARVITARPRLTSRPALLSADRQCLQVLLNGPGINYREGGGRVRFNMYFCRLGLTELAWVFN